MAKRESIADVVGGGKRKVVIFSPHCDDVPLSLGASLKAKVFGADVHVHVVFSKSDYLKVKKWKKHAASVSRRRQAEEREASGKFGYQAAFWGFPEFTLRHPDLELGKVCDPSLDPFSHRIFPAIVRKIERSADPKGINLFPMAAIGHLDHRIVHEIAKIWKSKHPSALFFFYEDVPLGAKLGPAEIGKMAKACKGKRILSVPSSVKLAREKSEGLLCYASQLDHSDLDLAESLFLAQNGEWLWHLK